MSKNWKPGEEVTAERLNDTGFGFKVVAQQTPDLTVRINKGVAVVDGTVVKYAGGNSPTITAPSANPRIDLITINSSGVIGVTNGAENASPVAPTYPTDKTVLAEIYSRVGMTEILDNDDSASEGYIYRDCRALGAPITLINASTGTSDAAKGIKTNAQGKIDITFGMNGGDGSDGALSITSGTTNIDCGGAAYVEKNYSSFSITGSGKLTFSNPHAFGTKVKFRSQSGFTMTSSTTPNIDISSMGGEGGGSQGGSNFMARSEREKG